MKLDDDIREALILIIVMLFITAVLCIVAVPVEAGEIPDNNITPGVTRDLSLQEICSTKWGQDHRAVTEAMKKQAFANYDMTGNDDPRCIPDANGKKCEIDHRHPRCAGGADDIRNLWPQSYGGACNAHQKDHLEDYVCKQICNGGMSLETSMAIFAGDWRESYAKYIDPRGCQ